VLRKPDGSVFLRVCFADPESPDLQPTIAPDGTSANSTSGCGDSDLLSPLPTGTPKIDQIATLPPASGKGRGKKQCMSRRSFTIRLKEPRGDALLSAVGPDGHWQAQVPHLRRLAQRAGQAQALSGG
jgi:hypothetical protein